MTRLYEIARAAGHERPSEVAHAMNEAQQTLKNWESRGISKAGLIKAQSIYGVNASWLETGKGNKGLAIVYPARQQESSYGNIGEKMPLRGRVPLISYVAAGNWSEAVDNFSPGNADAWIDTTIAVKQHTYALRVQGDLMEPKFPDGAIIIVEPEEEAKNGSFVIVRQNGSDATFKQLVYDGSQAYLKPLNQRYLTMPMQPDTVICGVVKQMVMDV
ncbi:MAG TPA: S24 family peptidase [Sideroxyarcus sp.]|nr:S24 family peptidase [Sideroxyarcus sp.]